ncbi:hypothetical protein ACFWN1_26160 [Streptomyces sp. NPDC058459]|uniref:hypothetical protein n=1 Tax=Streptomyces sp. NPDC058459 TaxID=3346508 RepID=UPI003647BAB8
MARPGRVDRLVLEDVGAPRPRPDTTPERPDGEPPADWAVAAGGITAQTPGRTSGGPSGGPRTR